MLGRKMSLVGGDHSLLAADFNDEMVKERSSETDWINKYVDIDSFSYHNT